MPRMTFRWIAAPVDNEICSILDFTKRASDFTTQLGGDFGWTMSQGGVAVQQSPEQVCHFKNTTPGVRPSQCKRSDESREEKIWSTHACTSYFRDATLEGREIALPQVALVH